MKMRIHLSNTKKLFDKPDHYTVRSLAPSREAKQNIFQFLLEEKGSRAKIEKREKCFALRPASGGGGAAGWVSSVPSVALRALADRQSRFALRSVIAIGNFGTGLWEYVA